MIDVLILNVIFRSHQNTLAVAQTPVTNPFGTLPAMPQITIGRSSGSGPSVQYGISSMPVCWSFQLLSASTFIMYVMNQGVLVRRVCRKKVKFSWSCRYLKSLLKCG